MFGFFFAGDKPVPNEQPIPFTRSEPQHTPKVARVIQVQVTRPAARDRPEDAGLTNAFTPVLRTRLLRRGVIPLPVIEEPRLIASPTLHLELLDWTVSPKTGALCRLRARIRNGPDNILLGDYTRRLSALETAGLGFNEAREKVANQAVDYLCMDLMRLGRPLQE